MKIQWNGSWFLMVEEFDGSFLIRAFLIERECVYHKELKFITDDIFCSSFKNNGNTKKYKSNANTCHFYASVRIGLNDIIKDKNFRPLTLVIKGQTGSVLTRTLIMFSELNVMILYANKFLLLFAIYYLFCF